VAVPFPFSFCSCVRRSASGGFWSAAAGVEMEDLLDTEVGKNDYDW
jgi:hypothetical protein